MLHQDVMTGDDILVCCSYILDITHKYRKLCV